MVPIISPFNSSAKSDASWNITIDYYKHKQGAASTAIFLPDIFGRADPHSLQLLYVVLNHVNAFFSIPFKKNQNKFAFTWKA